MFYYLLLSPMVGEEVEYNNIVRWLSGLKHLPAKKAIAQKVVRGFKSHSHCHQISEIL